MTFEVRLTAPAMKALERLPAEVAERLRTGMQVLKADPRRRRAGADVKKLHGEPGVFRLRIGDYRVFYVVFAGERVVYVTSVRHRSHAYD